MADQSVGVGYNIQKEYKMTKQELAYTAGIIDGEGSISIVKAKTCKSKTTQRGYLLELKVGVSNTDERLVRWLKKRYGGCIVKRRVANPRWKDYWEWRVQTAQAVHFLEMIQPWVLLKQQQIKIAIGFGKGRRIKKKSPKEMVDDDEARNAMLACNRRGKP